MGTTRAWLYAVGQSVFLMGCVEIGAAKAREWFETEDADMFNSALRETVPQKFGHRPFYDASTAADPVLGVYP